MTWNKRSKDILDFLGAEYFKEEMPSPETINTFLKENGVVDDITGLQAIDALRPLAGTDMPDHIAMPEGPAATAPTAIAQEYWPVVSTPLGDNRRRAMEKRLTNYFSTRSARS